MTKAIKQVSVVFQHSRELDSDFAARVNVEALKLKATGIKIKTSTTDAWGEAIITYEIDEEGNIW